MHLLQYDAGLNVSEQEKVVSPCVEISSVTYGVRR